MTDAQLAVLKTDINANANTVVFGTPPVPTQIKNLPNNTDANYEIKTWYNAQASPIWTVWKTMVTVTEIGRCFNGAELAGLTTANVTRLQTIAMYSAAGLNPSLPDQRAFFDDVFSGAGGTQTRPKLLALWKRLANRVEKLYTTGTGSDAAPATLDFEGIITTLDVNAARNLP